MPSYQHVKVPAGGQNITVNKDSSLNVPDQPVIPFIEGDGTGFDITPVMIKVVDAAVAKAYGGRRAIHWMEVYAGEKSTRIYGPDVWLPDETLEIVRDYVGMLGARLAEQAPGDPIPFAFDVMVDRSLMPSLVDKSSYTADYSWLLRARPSSPVCSRTPLLM